MSKPEVANVRPVIGRCLTLALIGGYAGLLHHVYREEVTPLFGYMNLVYRTPSPGAYAVALALVALIFLLMPYRLVRPSDFVLWVMFVMVAIPSLLVPQYADILPVDRTLELTLVVAATFLAIQLAVRAGPRIPLRVGGVDPDLLRLALIILSALVYLYMALTATFEFRLVALTSVYELRAEYQDRIAADGPLLAYLVRLQGNVVNPLLIAWGLTRRRWGLLAFGVLGQVPIFSVTGYKLILLSAPVIVLIVLVFRYRPRPLGAGLLYGVVLTILASLALDRMADTILYTQVFANRLLITPGVLTAAHVMVFEQIDKAQWSHAFLSPFLDYPHDLLPDRLVGAVMYGMPEVTGNANLFGDGYSNLGYPGIFIEAAVLVVLLWLLDGAASHLPIRISGAVLLIPTLALVNSSVFTSILSHGLLYAIVVLACLPAEGWDGRDPGGGRRPRHRHVLERNHA
ncbi:hypothetical protein ACQSSU_04560 [Micromonospora echinospora]